MRHVVAGGALCVLLILLFTAGCATHTEQGAALGGVLGAGTGAVVGHAMGNTAAGAVVGAGAGALTGAAIGNNVDEREARNRAQIEASLGRAVIPGAVSVGEVIAMTQARVHEDLIINHIRSHGMAAPLTTNDLIAMQQYGVSPRVVQTMQACPPVPPPVIVEQPPPPVIIGGYYGPGCHHHHYYW
jgi:hypothetical protein